MITDIGGGTLSEQLYHAGACAMAYLEYISHTDYTW